MSAATDPDVHACLQAGAFERRTARTIVDSHRLMAALDTIQRQGFAVDDEENEDGVACLAVPVWLTSPTMPSGAVSVSALAYRTPLPTLIDSVDEIRAIVTQNPQAMPTH